jgi:dipeptidyl aminopeptidase/acylaminoacyl peptidase
MSRTMFAATCTSLICLGVLAAPAAQPQQRDAGAPPDAQRLHNLEEALKFAEESLTRQSDDHLLFHRLDDLAVVDKVRYTGPPPCVIKNSTAQGAGNPVILSAYTFLPRKIPAGTRLPLIVLVHGGIHGNFDSSYVHILRELLQQDYAVLKGNPKYDDYAGRGESDIPHAHYTSSARWCGVPDPGYNPCIGVA